MTDQSPLSPATRCVWGGQTAPDAHGATVQPVYHAVTFGYDDLDEWSAVGTGERTGHIYSRNTNPTIETFEQTMRDLDGAEASTSFATGMAAISNTLFTFLSPGSRVVSIKDTYGGTNKLFVEFLPRFGVEVTLCETHDHEQIEREVAKGCDVLYLETPTNPTLKVLDIPRLAQAGRKAGATVVVDNTFATPINQRPLELGANLVLHSATKFLGGHSDAMGGIVSGDTERIRALYHFREINGASLDPMSAYLLTRGLRTLALRVERQNQSAQTIAQWLDSQPEIEAVYYPGLPDHPNHAVAKAQMSGFGGVLSFTLAGGMEALRAVVPALKLAHRAASLGSVGTLAGPPAMTSHVELSTQERANAGIPESLVRYSVGIEDPNDLIADLKAAFAHIPQTAKT